MTYALLILCIIIVGCLSLPQQHNTSESVKPSYDKQISVAECLIRFYNTYHNKHLKDNRTKDIVNMNDIVLHLSKVDTITLGKQTLQKFWFEFKYAKNNQPIHIELGQESAEIAMGVLFDIKNQQAVYIQNFSNEVIFLSSIKAKYKKNNLTIDCIE